MGNLKEFKKRIKNLLNFADNLATNLESNTIEHMKTVEKYNVLVLKYNEKKLAQNKNNLAQNAMGKYLTGIHNKNEERKAEILKIQSETVSKEMAKIRSDLKKHAKGFIIKPNKELENDINKILENVDYVD